MKIGIVVAAAENGAIGKDNRLLWRLPDDLKHFKSVTVGKPVIMGRKTFESIGKPLPDRANIVVSRQPDLTIAGCTVVGSLTEAIAAARAMTSPHSSASAEVNIIGGADIYRQSLSLANTVHLTRVHAHIDGDVFFPELPVHEWREVDRQHHLADERHAFAFSFLTLERNP